MSVAATQDLRVHPEAAWAQVTFFVPVLEAFPDNGQPGLPPWQDSVALFPLLNEPGARTGPQWRTAHIPAGPRAALSEQRHSAVLAQPVALSELSRRDGEIVQLRTGQLEFLGTGIRSGFGPGGILIIHAELRGSVSHGPGQDRLPVRWLVSQVKELARPPAGSRPAIEQYVRLWGLSLATTPDILVAANLTVPAATAAALITGTPAGADWDALRTWAWAFARGTVPSDSMLRAPAPPATPGHTVTFPRRVAVVDRGGVAIVATDPVDRDPNVRETLLEFVPVFQSVYTDVLALGYLQLLVTEEVGSRLDALDDPVNHPVEFHHIESRMRLLRNQFWRARITQWPWLDDVLRRYQQENSLREIIDQLSANISDFSDQLERSYQHSLNLILLLLSVLGFFGVAAGIFAAVSGFMAVLGTGRWGVLVGIAATGAALIVLMMVGVLYLRRSAWRELAPYLRPRR